MGHITPQMFGAKGDWNDTAGVGTDDTQAFKQAIAYAINQGYKKLYVPAGNYYITDTLNLGENYTGDKGIAIEGENWISTKFFFKPTSNDHACFESKGGSDPYQQIYQRRDDYAGQGRVIYGHRLSDKWFLLHAA